MSRAGHRATEQRSPEAALAELGNSRRWARKILARLGRVAPLPPGATILDVGAAQGLFLIACAELGYRVVGVEPWDAARAAAAEIAARVGVAVEIRDGVAEDLPADAGSVDVVHASYVVEHVADPARAFREAHRVLRPGGVFWFATVSSLCPCQPEIRGFPAFGWYPDRVKRRIMLWARDRHPGLVGGTRMPALNWFTPGKARRMLREAGFGEVHDRWDLRRPEEGGAAGRLALRLVRLGALTRLAADVVVPGCAYAAVKAGPPGVAPHRC